MCKDPRYHQRHPEYVEEGESSLRYSYQVVKFDVPLRRTRKEFPVAQVVLILPRHIHNSISLGEASDVEPCRLLERCEDFASMVSCCSVTGRYSGLAELSVQGSA